MMSDRQLLHIGFLHPALGLGGAERLVVNAALHLQAVGHRVTIFTAHHDRVRCFEETRNGSLDVRVYGGFLPSHVGQRLRAACAIARLAYLTGAMALSGERCDVIFCDLVAHVLPLLKCFGRAKLLFYCHFPDQLLAPQRHWLYRFYRAPIDRLEAVGTGMADRVLVNSRFTAAIFRQTFPHLHAMPLEVLYPGIDCTRYSSCPADYGSTPGQDIGGDAREVLILSINRYERKKNLGLVIEAVALLRERLSSATFAPLRLVIAGSYDDRLRESCETLRDLQALVQQLRLAEHVVFLRSCTEAERLALLARCRCVVYTPANEHFGFVPVEAMAAGRPVLAVASGGPLETVQHEHTGLLCQPTPLAFAEALARLITHPEAAERMGQAGRRHVAKHFSQAAFGARLEAILQALVAPSAGTGASQTSHD
jgi:alpha-1,3/alpha-1,6-mannosyltransferase